MNACISSRREISPTTNKFFPLPMAYLYIAERGHQLVGDEALQALHLRLLLGRRHGARVGREVVPLVSVLRLLRKGRIQDSSDPEHAARAVHLAPY